MSSDSDDDVLACTPLQRCRSQLSSSQAPKEKKFPKRPFLTQTENRSKNDTSFRKFKSPSKKSIGRGKERGKGKSKLSSSFKRESNDVKPEYMSLAKKRFLYGEDNIKEDEPSCSQLQIKRELVKEQDRKPRKAEEKWQSVKQEEDWKESVCPHCMMPWDIYNTDAEQKDLHINHCLDQDLSSLPDCKYGMKCKEILENHFWAFKHQALATLHSMKQFPGNDSGYEDRSMESSSCVFRPTKPHSNKWMTKIPNSSLDISEINSARDLHKRLDNTGTHSTRINSEILKKSCIKEEIICLDSDSDEDKVSQTNVSLFNDSLNSCQNIKSETSEEIEFGRKKEENSSKNCDRPTHSLSDSNSSTKSGIGKKQNYVASKSSECGRKNAREDGSRNSSDSYSSTKSGIGKKHISVASKSSECGRKNAREDGSRNSSDSNSSTKSGIGKKHISVASKSGGKSELAGVSGVGTDRSLKHCSTPKDFSSLIDLDYIPDIDLDSRGSGRFNKPDDKGGEDSLDQTILFNEEEQSDEEDFFNMQTQPFQNTPKESDKNMEMDSNDGTFQNIAGTSKENDVNMQNDPSYKCTQPFKNIQKSKESDRNVQNESDMPFQNIAGTSKENYGNMQNDPSYMCTQPFKNIAGTSKETIESDMTVQNESDRPFQNIAGTSKESDMIEQNENDRLQQFQNIQSESDSDNILDNASDKSGSSHISTSIFDNASRQLFPIEENNTNHRTIASQDSQYVVSEMLDLRYEHEGNLAKNQNAPTIAEEWRDSTQMAEENSRETIKQRGSRNIPLEGNLENSNDDELLASLVEIAVEKYLGDVVDKVREQRNNNKSSICSESQCEERDENTAASSNSHDHCKSNGGCCKASTKPCIHVHFHINSPSPSKGGQTSILNYFQPKNNKGEQTEISQNSGCSVCNCQCAQSTPQQNSGDKCNKDRGSGKRQGVDEWKDVMARMKQRRTALPSVSSISTVSSENRDTGTTSHMQEKGWRGNNRKCPFYKYIPDTDVVVDAFSYGSLDGIRAYFLTHFHYDHYRGITKHFSHPIYCSHITGRLLQGRVGVKEQYIFPLPMNEPQCVCGFEVTLLDANHCPGAVMLLFKLRTGRTILHTGDFRAHPRMESYPAFWNIPNINTLFLDTTYCNPVYDFPSQEEVLDACVVITQRHMALNPDTLFVVGSYTIGKERVFKIIAETLDCKVWASGDKRRTLSYVDDPEIQARITTDKTSARVHVLIMKELTHKKLMGYVSGLKPHYKVVVAFKPTGWEHSAETPTVLESITPKQVGNVSIYGMPYSEHSSFHELRRFVQFTQPERIIPTVNVGNAHTRGIMETHFNDWLKAKRKF